MIVPNTVTPIIKLTEACNYSCYFCRYANHPQNDCVIKVENVEHILLEAVKYNVSRGSHQVKVIFHGGEPLLWGYDRFEKILLYEDKLAIEYSTRFVNSIQTNGSLLNKQWIALLKKYNLSIGISLDGPGNLNGHFGKKGNSASVTTVLANLQMLKQENIPFGVLSVITNAHATHAQAFYEYWVEHGIENIGLCYCYNPEDAETVSCSNLSMFLIQLFDLYFYGKAKINIREFNNAIQKKLTQKASSCTFACRENCGHFLTIDPRMHVMFCDDYDLNKASALGSMQGIGFEEIIASEKYQDMCKQSRQIVETHCAACLVKDFCGFGCNRNDTRAGNYFCSVYKEVYLHIAKALEKINFKHQAIRP